MYLLPPRESTGIGPQRSMCNSCNGLLLSVMDWLNGCLCCLAMIQGSHTFALLTRNSSAGVSMPVTMLQLLNFFFASFAMAQPGSWIEKLAMIMPFSSPFTMLAHAAQDPALWPHALAIAWQLVCVAVLIKLGANLFKKRVMQSGPQRGKKRRFWQRSGAPAASASA